ncbi:hypothetical protein GOP47_0014163, partial [Adiantum capillus-veneris]
RRSRRGDHGLVLVVAVSVIATLALFAYAITFNISYSVPQLAAAIATHAERRSSSTSPDLFTVHDSPFAIPPYGVINRKLKVQAQERTAVSPTGASDPLQIKPSSRRSDHGAAYIAPPYEADAVVDDGAASFLMTKELVLELMRPSKKNCNF